MYALIHHVTMKFNGCLKYEFTFDIRYTEDEMYDCLIPNADIKKNFQVRDDGYLYIQGRKITNNANGIRTINASIRGRGVSRSGEERYIDTILSIDSSGYVVETKHTDSPNQISRFLTKLLC